MMGSKDCLKHSLYPLRCAHRGEEQADTNEGQCSAGLVWS